MTSFNAPAAVERPPGRIGGTPLVPVRVPVRGGSLRLWLKLEWDNPFGSIKARTAEALLDALEATGRLGPGNRVVESTSGNLGVALAGLCAARGYACTLVVEPSTPHGSVARMRELGADVVVVPDVPGGRTLDARLRVVDDLLRRDPTAVWTDQYHSAANPGVHESRTAAELVRQAPNGSYDAVAVAVSTGGTLAGVAQFFRDHLPTARVIAVDAVGSAALGGPVAERPCKLAGFGSGRPSGFVRPHHVDDVVRVRDEDAAAACVLLQRATGLSLGGSAGAAVLAAVVRAAADPALREVACVCPDSGEKYPLTETAARVGTTASPDVATALDALGRARAGTPHAQETPLP
ncbi:pyridoxal-phosphate dependent enzyme [Streptomyces dangxiongensis]|uniref:Pyridoxal-phosphate dependent enzyme n=1 Tax=Streptomyces dangxiongensis TaxID=1442032 RepID=A0A3G2JAR9_9ACTN|nr:pyridoxal-phosphate dependent enzyme [Streptomyces dangxiongensis]AYN39410.1 pyridoxal-phosphate dependent enzyme [Streptomyces dangxiongensis]